jgi:hypothetical protein
MAIERADLSGSLNVDQAPPVASTPAGQNRGAPDGGRSQPRRPGTSKTDSVGPPKQAGSRDPENGAEPNDAEQKKEDEGKNEDSERPHHRIDRLA